MKELDSFTVERLEEILNFDLPRHPAALEEIVALARIALAAKRAEPNELADAVNEFLAVLDDYPEQLVPINSEAALVKDLRKALSSTPQLNSPEIPEGWKLVPIIAYPSQWAAGQKAHNNSGINKVDAVYKAMVAAAPDASGFDPSLPGAEATVITHYHTPDGYKLVPTDITKAMRDAWDSTPNNHEDDDVNMCNAYRAMIAAAPEKPL
ncbi:hypothetical protein [Yersinia frederiksenii]|uniref:hypothetical protein n=1 Tax=Yersinia frederiksenii TaxID=29484 RepID=UPI0005DF6B7D|nr:hypothetical protein [Yersinia frederiksenii]CQH41791.1 Uncharacterised protein [Yersinia frederiksenii]